MERNTPIRTNKYPTRLGIYNYYDNTPIPSLLKVNKSSYNAFLQRFTPFSKRADLGLEHLLRKFIGDAYIGYVFGTAHNTIEECIRNSKTYSIPLYIYVYNNALYRNITRLYIGEIPLLTKSGSFIINGVENTIVNQLTRDSGIYVDTTEVSSLRNSLKIRGLKGRTVQLDIIENNFIGRKLNNHKKKERINTHQDINVLLDNIDLSFKDLAYALTYTIDAYEYSYRGWRLLFDWSSMKHNKYSTRVYNISMNNLFPVHGQKLSTEEYRNVLCTSIEKIYVEDLSKYKEKKYMLIDIYNKYGNSIFSLSSYKNYSSKLLVSLLSYIGMPYHQETTSFSLQSLIQELHTNHTFLFINADEQNNYYNTSLMNLFTSKKNRLIKLYTSTSIDHDHEIVQAQIREDNVVRTYKECSISQTARKRINCLLGLSDESEHLSPKDIVCIVRHLIQIHNNIVSLEDINEQDLYNKKFSSIGEQLYTCLKDALVDSKTRADIHMYRRGYSNTDNIENKIESCKHAIRFLVRYLSRSSLCQYTEQVNPLAYVTHSRKISLMGPGGLKNDNVSLELRDVHISSYGRICPIETPEGKSVGVVTSLSLFTRVNKDNQLESPYIHIVNGYLTNNIHYLTPMEERTKYIALANQVVSKDGSFLYSNDVYCRHNNQTVIVPAIMVNYIELSNKQLTSLSTSMIPFLEHNDANRALMGSNMQRQAVPLSHIENTLVGTGMESIAPRDIISLDHKLNKYYIPFGDLISINEDSTQEYYKNIISNALDTSFTKTHALTINRYTNQKTLFTQYVQGSITQDYTMYNPTLGGYATAQNEVSLGNNILIAFTSMNGHTFEDSIVISERLLRKNYLQSIHLEVYKTIESQESDAQEVIQLIPNVPNMDTDGVVILGTNVKKDDILVCKEKRQLLSSNKNKLIVSDKSMKYKGKKSGYIIDKIKLFQHKDLTYKGYTKHSTRYFIKTQIKDLHAKRLIHIYPYLLLFHVHTTLSKIIVNKTILHNSHIRALLPSSFIWSPLLKIAMSYDKVDFNDLLNYRMKIYIYFIYRLWHIEKELLKVHYLRLVREICDSNSILYNDELISSGHDKIHTLINDSLSYNMRMQPSYTTLKVQNISLCSDILYLLDSMLPIVLMYQSNILKHVYASNIRRNNNRQIRIMDKTPSVDKHTKEDYSLKMVKIVVVTRHPIQVGDKLTGRYGNKGVISRVLCMEDMPYLKDGSPVDIILSPLGVSSRMNIGQLFENYLGNISSSIGTQIQQFMYWLTEDRYLNIRHHLFNIYKDSKELIYMHNLDKKDIIELYNKLSHGMSVSTQVFNSFTSTDLDMLSRKIGLDTRGKVDLLDGMTGEVLDNKVTAGYLYIMKLNHLVDHKIHGRSTGPYNVVTQQASKGKSRNGGQRLGEMEVWALQAYGAAYTLQEMLTFKSDSTVARTNFLQQFIKGKSYRIDIPRTFKLLRDELRVLGMELNFIVHNKK